EACHFSATGSESKILDKDAAFADMLESRRFRHDHKPEDLPPRFFIGQTPICTAGNLTVISAAPKGGKSALVGAMLAATMSTTVNEADCLGIKSLPQNVGEVSGAILHLDTEQSELDHWLLLDRALRRAGVSDLPPWLWSYWLRGWSIPDTRLALETLLA